MSNKRRIIVAFVIGVCTTLVVIFLFCGSLLQAANFQRFVEQHYDGEYDEQVMQESIYEGIAAGFGDPHTTYIKADEIEQFNQSLDTSYEGIGIRYSIDEDAGTAQITEVMPTGPAAEFNIKPGDYIRKVNGEEITTENVAQVSELVKANSTVKLELYRPSTDETINVEIPLAEYTSPSISYKLYVEGEQKIGYIDIDSFSNTTDEEFATALTDLESQGMTKLVIDVRDNGGGELESVVNICNMIVPNTMPYLVTKDGEEVVDEYTSTLTTPKEYEIIGLQNENSASASEILMGALKFVNGSQIIGQTSYGKGSVQTLYPVPSTGGAVKITIQHWYTADGSCIDGTGITPTIEITEEQMSGMLPVTPIILEENLQAGDSGYQVLQVNYYLYVNGYKVEKNSNVYSSQTTAAVKQFQKDSNLKQTGVVDLETAELLYEKALENCHNFNIDPYMAAALGV